MARRLEIRSKRQKPIKKQITDWRLGSWNCRSLNFLGFQFALANELQPRNFDVVALQEVCLEEEQVLDWPGRQTDSRFFMSGGKDKKLGTGFIVRGKMQDRVFGFTAISERMCKLRIRGRFFNYSIINVHCPHEEKSDDEKEAFYATLEEVYDGCPRQDVKVIIGDMNARFGREEMYRPTIGPESLHSVTNDNGQRCIDFAASRGMVVRSTYFPRKDIHKATWTSPDQRTKTQIDHLSTVFNQRRSRRAPPFNTACLQNGEVAHSYAQQLEVNLPGEEELGAASLEDGWSRIRSAIGSAAEATLGSAIRVSRNDWYDDECQRIIAEKKAAYDRKLHKATRGNVERYRQARNRQVAVFKLKKRQQEDRDCAEMEQLFRANESRKFYEKVNRSRKGFVPRADACRDNEGNLIVNKSEVLDRWKQYFNEHLNGDEADGDGVGVNLGAPAADEQFPAPDLETGEKTPPRSAFPPEQND
ncbi:uncharacterized protein LOC119766064 [Culex quinquefasciatus]|uniref:uncharacterized protein LOC119766064 n=1 Tax=Culex quinquefasciatus TaxID=7176 RepID=UPI0018E2E320|nr:uncharacterized protein LOC119766064 [Culex quinquefasciatus]